MFVHVTISEPWQRWFLLHLEKQRDSRAHKSSINTDKSVNDSDIQSNNNFATPADISNQDNANELPQSRTFRTFALTKM